jgi:hypothetical protein
MKRGDTKAREGNVERAIKEEDASASSLDKCDGRRCAMGGAISDWTRSPMLTFFTCVLG